MSAKFELIIYFKSMFEYPELSSINEAEMVTKLFDNANKEKALVFDSAIKGGGNNFMGPTVPKIYGGLGWDFRQYLRFVEELAKTDVYSAISHSLLNTNAFKTLLLFGTDEQKIKWIGDSISHSKPVSLAYAEKNCGSDFTQNQTTAYFDDEKKAFVINGCKSWVLEGNVFLVAAKVDCQDTSGFHTIFIVDDLEGVEVVKDGFFNVVKFTNVTVPPENIVGRRGEGVQIIQTVQSYGRAAVSAIVLGALKGLLESIVRHTRSKTSFGRRLSEYGLIRKKISSLSQTIYSIESMLYHVGGIACDDLDFLMESQALKIYSTQQFLSQVSSVVDIIPENVVDMFSAANDLCSLQGSNNMLILSLALHGVENGIPKMAKMIRQLDNPLENIFIKIKFNMKILEIPYLKGSQTLKLKIPGFVHPSLAEQANILESAILRLNAASLYVVRRKSSVDEQIFLDRISRLTICVYRLFASLTRASRSLCIGLTSGSLEMNIARLIAAEVDIAVDGIVREIENDIVKSMDDGVDHIASAVIRDDGYVALHALTRQW